VLSAEWNKAFELLLLSRSSKLAIMTSRAHPTSSRAIQSVPAQPLAYVLPRLIWIPQAVSPPKVILIRQLTAPGILQLFDVGHTREEGPGSVNELWMLKI
jgi:hypothetical protein